MLSPTNSGGLGLLEFTQAFAWPSEVYRVSPKTGKSERAFREKDRRITDILITSTGTAYMAGVSTVGALYNGPIPGKLKVYRSEDLETWTEIPVDYRAEARYATLSESGDSIWVATDFGMILKLVDK